MLEARIWILIADAEMARICSSRDGTTKVIPMPILENALNEADAQRTAQAYRAWYAQERRSFLFTWTAKQQYAAHIAQLLLEAARESAYDGLLIVATPEIETELSRVLAPEVLSRLIGDVIRDLPYAQSPEPSYPEQIRH